MDVLYVDCNNSALCGRVFVECPRRRATRANFHTLTIVVVDVNTACPSSAVHRLSAASPTPQCRSISSPLNCEWVSLVLDIIIISSSRNRMGYWHHRADEEEEEDFAQTLRSVAWELIPLFGPLSRRGLNPIKPVYDPDWPDGRLNLTASAFKIHIIRSIYQQS